MWLKKIFILVLQPLPPPLIIVYVHNESRRILNRRKEFINLLHTEILLTKIGSSITKKVFQKLYYDC